MKLIERLRSLFTKGKSEPEMLPSLVILQRVPHFFTSAELEQAGERGFGKSFDGKQNPMYFVVQESFVTFIKAGAHVINMMSAKQPYLDKPEEVARQLPRVEQKRAWLAHTAWTAFDSHNDKLPPSEAYTALARLVLHLGDANCTGVYIPGEGVFLPNDGTAEEGLRKMIDGGRFS